MKKKILTILAVVFLGTGFMGCGQQEEEGKILSVQVGPNPETIDPALNSSADGGNIILHAFEGLLTVDENGELAPGQAKRWEVSKDGLVWTFHLREGLKWSDGSDLTAHDFVYSWKRLCDPMVAAPYAETVLGMVEGFEEAVWEGNPEALKVVASDEKTLEVTLTKPCPYFGSLAAFTVLSPVQQETVETHGDAWAVSPETYISNGSFYVTEWVPGAYIKMSKNPYYWNADAIQLDHIKFHLMEDSNAAYSAYQTGEVMLIKDVPTEELATLKKHPEYFEDQLLGTYYINFNLKQKPFDDVKVRKAMSLAIDREYVANTIMQGTYSPAYNFVGPGWADVEGREFFEQTNQGQTYLSKDYEENLKEAKKLLAQAGYPDGEGLPVITYTTNEGGYHKAVAEYLQQAWAQLGIDLVIEIAEWGSFTSLRRNGDYMLARNGWVGDHSDPSNILELFYSTNGNNDGNYQNAGFDAAMDLAASTTDEEVRFEALHRAEDILMEDMACIPIAYHKEFWLQSKKITGIYHTVYGYWNFMYGDLAGEQ